MTARWVVVKAPPRTAICPGCKARRNRLSVYPTGDGLACYQCLRTPVRKVVAMNYGQCPAILPSGAQCQRYANHKGEHRATMTRKGGKVAA